MSQLRDSYKHVHMLSKKKNINICQYIVRSFISNWLDWIGLIPLSYLIKHLLGDSLALHKDCLLSPSKNWRVIFTRGFVPENPESCCARKRNIIPLDRVVSTCSILTPRQANQLHVAGDRHQSGDHLTFGKKAIKYISQTTSSLCS